MRLYVQKTTSLWWNNLLDFCVEKGYNIHMNKDRLNFNIAPLQKRKLEQLAKDKQMSVSELLRRIIDEWFDRQAKEDGR